ncbi:MAG: hypothetical protein ABR569_11705 [Gaiellaceae bacterium]
MGNWVVWSSLVIGALVAGGALTRFAFVARQGWRNLKRSRHSLFTELDRVAEAADAVAGRAEALGAGTDELMRSVTRLRESRRRLAVLQAAVGETQEALAVVTWIAPHK